MKISSDRTHEEKSWLEWDVHIQTVLVAIKGN